MRQRNFAFVWVAGFISSAGDWALMVALPYHTYALTGSPLLTGSMFITYTLPRVFLSSVAGVLVDRWDRRRTMIVCDLSRALILLLLLFAQTHHDIWIVYLVTFFEASTAQLFYPAKAALIPRIVEQVNLTPANALESSSMGITRLIGPPLGAGLFVAMGLWSLVVVDAASYVLSAVLISAIRPSSLGQVPKSSERPAPSSMGRIGDYTISLLHDLVAGFRLVTAKRVTTTLFGTMGLVMLGYGITTVLLVVFVRDVLGGDTLQLGVIVTAQGAGLLVGTLVISKFGRRLASSAQFSIGLAVCGLAFMMAYAIHRIDVVTMFFAVSGLGMSLWMVSERTMLQTYVVDEFRGRVFGTYGTSNSLFILTGMAAASGFGGILGPIPLLTLAAALYCLAGVVAATRLRKLTAD